MVQEAKALQRTIRSRDKERAERATLVAQERMVTLRAPKARLPDVWVRPALGGRGRKVPGVLEVHQVIRWAKWREDMEREGDGVKVPGHKEQESVANDAVPYQQVNHRLHWSSL